MKTQEEDLRSKLPYHARMLAFSLVCGVTIFVLVIGVVFLLLSLGVWHIEDR
jgi:hypothetical protein